MEICKKPCDECPFREDSLPGWLSTYTAIELHTLVMNEFPFPCHMTHNDNLDWEEAGKYETPLCGGALRYMRKNAKSPRRQDIAIHVNSLTQEDCKGILSTSDFFTHHNKFK